MKKRWIIVFIIVAMSMSMLDGFNGNKAEAAPVYLTNPSFEQGLVGWDG